MAPLFVRGQLTRNGGTDSRTLTFAVIDLATTGLDPAHGARVCEAAVVRMRGDGVTGQWPTARHSALGDARAKAAILAKLIGAAPQPLRWVGGAPVPLPDWPRSGTIAPRAAWLRKGSEGWLATLTARLPYVVESPPPRPEGLRDYRALLAHALVDGRIVGEEATQLAVLAARAGLTQTTARQVHEEFLADARARAEADGVVTSAELRELQRAARELAASHLITDLEEAAAANRARGNGPLKGWRVLPVGDRRRSPRWSTSRLSRERSSPSTSLPRDPGHHAVAAHGPGARRTEEERVSFGTGPRRGPLFRSVRTRPPADRVIRAGVREGRRMGVTSESRATARDVECKVNEGIAQRHRTLPSEHREES